MNKIVAVRTDLMHMRNDIGRDASSGGDRGNQALSLSAGQHAASACGSQELTQTRLEHRKHPHKVGRFETKMRADDVLRLGSCASQDGWIPGGAPSQESNSNLSRTVFIFDRVNSREERSCAQSDTSSRTSLRKFCRFHGMRRANAESRRTFH